MVCCTNFKNLVSFQKNISGHLELIELTEKYTNSNTPYIFSLEQQTNRLIQLSTQNNLNAFPPITPINKYQPSKLIPENVKTYYVQLRYGGGIDINKDVILWQNWRKTFGFQKIPLGFSVLLDVFIGRGTQIAFSFSPTLENPEYVIIRYNRWDRIPEGYPLYIKNPINSNNIIGRDYYTNIDGIVYDSESDAQFKKNYPKLYNNCLDCEKCR